MTTSGMLVVACLFAGIYGALHNQISYTVSPEYFHKFKFIQFDIANPFQNRMGASIVGFLASWWMGILISAVLIAFTRRSPVAPRRYVMALLQSYAVVAFTALFVGLVALVFSFYIVTDSDARAIEIYTFRPVLDSVAFLRAGTMHNFSYLGGVVGIFTGAAFLRRTLRDAVHEASEVS